MSVVVTGCGRSGTNIALEILRGNSHFKATKRPEDKRFFHRDGYYPPTYLTKCDTHYYGVPALNSTKRLNPHLKIVWCIRDPRDMAMSKLYRGRAFGDRPEEAEDATYEGLVRDIQKMLRLYHYVVENYPDDIRVVHMENSIQNTEATTKGLCDWLGVRYCDAMLDFPSRMRNAKKRERYGDGVDTSQVNMYERSMDVYGGWFVGRSFSGHTIIDIFKELTEVCEVFGYAKV